MTKKQTREYKAANQQRKAVIIKGGYAHWLGGVIQDGKYTKPK